MKLHLMTVLATAVLLLPPQTARALDADSQPDAGASARTMMQQNANASAQATTDMSFGDSGQNPSAAAQGVQNASYGGVAAGQSQMGEKQDRPCNTGSQCRIYFGQ